MVQHNQDIIQIKKIKLFLTAILPIKPVWFQKYPIFEELRKCVYRSGLNNFVIFEK